MGKVVKFTGSKVLGAELKRLRGGRTLASMAELTQTPPFSDWIRPLSAPTLCQIESGKTMPTLDTMHALAMLYRVNPQRLYDLILQGRVAERCEGVPESAKELAAEYKRTLAARDWDRALSLALAGEHRARTVAEQLTWRANRAVCMDQQGMRSEAITLLQECANDPEYPSEQLWQTYNNLTRMYSLSGLHREAESAARHAAGTAPADVSLEGKARLALARSLPLLARAQDDDRGVERQLRESLRQLEAVAGQLGADQAALELALDAAQSRCHWRLGNSVLARERFTRLWATAKDAPRGEAAAAVWSALGLAGIHREQRRPAEARNWFERAERLASELDMHDDAFEASFELLRIARETRASTPLVERLQRKCERLFPLVEGRTPSTLAFTRQRQGIS